MSKPEDLVGSILKFTTSGIVKWGSGKAQGWRWEVVEIKSEWNIMVLRRTDIKSKEYSQLETWSLSWLRHMEVIFTPSIVKEV